MYTLRHCKRNIQKLPPFSPPSFIKWVSSSYVISRARRGIYYLWFFNAGPRPAVLYVFTMHIWVRSKNPILLWQRMPYGQAESAAVVPGYACAVHAGAAVAGISEPPLVGPSPHRYG